VKVSVTRRNRSGGSGHLIAGGFLATGACLSAFTRNQLIAFVLTVVACFGFLLSGFPLVLDLFSGWAPQVIVAGVIVA
jgi:ABC-2 type transport system permease protein